MWLGLVRWGLGKSLVSIPEREEERKRNKKGKMSEDQPVASLQERQSNGSSEQKSAPVDFLPFCHYLSLNLDPLLL